MNEIDKVVEFYKLVEPIADLIDKNKERIDLLFSEIEDDINTSIDDWTVIEEVESALLNLSFSGGDTPMKDLKELMEGS